MLHGTHLPNMPGGNRTVSEESDRFATGSPPAPPTRVPRGQASGLGLGVRYFSQDEPPPLDTLISFSDSMYNATGRSVSSTSSMLSTPSNNIRAVQSQRQMEHARQQASKPPGTPKPQHASTFSKNGRFLKSKLLNLLQSLKRFIRKGNASSGEGSSNNTAVGENNLFHLLQKISGYDYRLFSHRIDKGRNSLPVKDSQIKAWESAEKVTASIIFAESPEDEVDLDSDPETSEEPPITTNIKHESRLLHLLSLPGYTKPELDIVMELLHKDKHFSNNPSSFDAQQKCERDQSINHHRQEVQAHHERAFWQTHSFATRRQIQIAQKRELIVRMFGNSNQLNAEYVTNNSCYLALDSSSNVQKVIYEDKSEMGMLLEEEQAFVDAMSDTSRKFRVLKHEIDYYAPGTGRPAAGDEHGQDPLHLNRMIMLDIIARRLGKIYHKSMNPNSEPSPEPSPEPKGHRKSISLADNSSKFDGISDAEIQRITVAHLRLCVREELEPKFSIPPIGD